MADDSPSETSPSADVVRPKRVAGTILDMVRSLGVMAVVIAVTLIFVPGLLHPNKSQRFAAVSYSADSDGFHELTGHRALVPSGLGKGWYANSANLERRPAVTQLHIGWVTPSNKYLSLEESNDVPGYLVRSTLGVRGAAIIGTENINAFPWDRHVSERGEKALSCTVGPITIVITGSASQRELDQLAASLRIAAAP